RYKTTLAPIAECLASGVPATANRVGLAPTLLDQIVIKEPHGHQPLLKRGIGETCAGPDVHHVLAARIAPCQQVADVACDRRPAGRQWLDAFTNTDREVVGKPPAVSLDGPGREAEVGLHTQPLDGLRLLGNRWPAVDWSVLLP